MPNINQVRFLVCHHLGGTAYNPYADTASQTFDDVNRWHRDAKDANGQPKYHYGQPSSLGYYLAYHYFIARDGKVTQARADTEIGYHTIGYNDKSIGIALAGNFDVYIPTWEQTLSLKSLLTRLIVKYGVKLENVVPHRFASPKSCYGKKLTDSWARDLVRDNINQYTTLLGQIVFHLKLYLQKLQSGKMVVGESQVGERECGGFIN